ncbi:MAG TPA: hypothetical protein VLK65_21490 [Vicinamibacteria bacterium]|nr:hypothetical protein [Vicinamibacteria bacterium]
MRPPVNLSRLRYHRDSQLFLYHPKAGQVVDDLADPIEFFCGGQPFEEAPQHLIPSKEPECGRLAPVLIHIPEPHKHQVHFYGAYANRVRSNYRREDANPPGQNNDIAPPRRALSKRWSELIYRIHEVDPLICLRCGARMKILAFIIEPDVIRRILDHLDSGSRQRAPPSSTRIH